jgi:small subunit ribosomal protein S4
MAKDTGPDCKLCRREGEKLFLKGDRCFTPKCQIERRPYAPGQHGRAGAQGGSGGRGKKGGSGRESDYGKQLRAKQKARRIYGIYERQFRRYYATALKARGITGLMLLQILESRLDNVVFRLGYAVNRAQARLLVTHGHFTVNGRRTDVPSATIKVGDVVAVREGSRGTTFFKDLPPVAETRNAPAWLTRDLNSFSGSVLRLPERPEIDGNLNEQLIVEYYSR